MFADNRATEKILQVSEAVLNLIHSHPKDDGTRQEFGYYGNADAPQRTWPSRENWEARLGDTLAGGSGALHPYIRDGCRGTDIWHSMPFPPPPLQHNRNRFPMRGPEDPPRQDLRGSSYPHPCQRTRRPMGVETFSWPLTDQTFMNIPLQNFRRGEDPINAVA